MKKILLFCTILLFSVTPFAASKCKQALPTNDEGFCASFKSIAQCHCVEPGLPAGMCQDVEQIYKRMISVFGSTDKACSYQKDTDKQTCLDDWKCYREGGQDSQGRLCSGVGLKCS